MNLFKKQNGIYLLSRIKKLTFQSIRSEYM